ncbi:MAG: AMP-binding protein [Chloroflexota bacterium]
MAGPLLPDPTLFAADWFERQAALNAGKVAVVLPEAGPRVTYAELAEGAARVAGGLRGLGVRPGDRVAALALNGLPLLELLFACGRFGAILVPLNYRLAERELLWLAADAAPALLAYEDTFAAPARLLAAATGARLVALEEAASGALGYDQLRAAEPAAAAPLPLDTPWCILYTGGTTGRPKGAVLTHGSMLWNALNTVLSWGLRSDDVAPIFTPIFHTGGFNVFLLPLLLAGGTVVLPRRFDAEAALATLVAERATLLFLVPTMFQLLAETPGFAAADLSAIRWAISGGAPCPERLYDVYRPKVRVFKQGYGLTEVGPNEFATPDDLAARKRGSVGRPTLFLRYRVVDAAGVDLPAGAVGELLLAGPTVCAGYWRNPEATAAAYDGEWWRTGDLVRYDADGYFYIVDRKGDLIISGGENIYPAEVEEALYAHPAVAEAAVVGQPDPRWGEVVVGVVALHAGGAVGGADLTEHCRARLARYKVPKRFVFLESLPKSAAGKILRAEVRRLLGEP